MQDLLVTVFENGHLLKEYSFVEIRERAELPLVKEQRPTLNGMDEVRC